MQSPLQNAPESKKKASIAAILIGVVAMIFFASVKSTLLPVAASEIGGTAYYTIASTVPSVFSVICMPLFGFLCTRNPALKLTLFKLGMLLSAVGLCLSALVKSIVTLTVAMSLYAPCGAAVFVCGYSLISEMYDRQKAGVYLGLCGTFMAIGQLIAPIVGGLIIQYATWRILCVVCGLLCVVPALIMLAGVRMSRETASQFAIAGVAFDAVGAVSMALFLGGVVLALSLGSSIMPFGGLLNSLCLIAALLGLVVLVIDIRKKGARAIIPGPALRDRNTLLFSLANLFNNFSAMSVFFFMPTYILYVLNGTPTQASISTTCFGFLGLILGAVFGKSIGRSGTARNVGILGNVIRLAVMLTLALFLNPGSSIWFIYIVMFVGGIFNSAHTVVFSAGPQVQIKPEIRVSSNSVIQTTQNFGSLMGTTVYTLMMGIFGIADGLRVAFYIAAGVGGLCLLCMLPLKTLEQQNAASS